MYAHLYVLRGGVFLWCACVETERYSSIIIVQNIFQGSNQSQQNKKLIVQRDYLRKIAEQNYIYRMQESWSNVPEGGPSDDKVSKSQKVSHEFFLSKSSYST